ncbi:hypothetical protein FQZ97_813050 [compost metagenome]
MSQKKKTAPSHRQGHVERIQENGTVRQQIIAQSIEGPLPAPSVLADYDRVYPGLAKVIVESFQNETAHRHGMERQAMAIEEKVSTAYVQERKRGQTFGLVIAVMLVGGSIALGALGQGWAAAALGGVGFASIVGAFVAGRSPAPAPTPAPRPEAEQKQTKK